jgi:DNA-binding FadR family transcriptional regulator
MTAATLQRRPPKLAHEIVESLGGRIRSGGLAAGDKLPTEADLMAEFSVSRTVVREAISRLQAAGLVETRHGVGTFVIAPPGPLSFRIAREQLATLDDVIAMLELRIGVEVEAAGLAAQRRTDDNLARMRAALDSFVAATEARRNAVGADFEFHLEVMRATQNAHFVQLLQTLGTAMIPRARWTRRPSTTRRGRTICAASTPSTRACSMRSSTRTPRRRAPRRARTWRTAASAGAARQRRRQRLGRATRESVGHWGDSVVELYDD